MDFEFDKEIDAILRKARGDDAAALSSAHLDADDIAAFAENALPAAARGRYTAHFADCARCRKILSNAFVFNAEADAETASSAVSAPTTEAGVPWYRRLFAFPQAAYAMGAMVLLFSGFFGYLILQNLSGASNEVSYSANSATNTAAPAPERPPAAMSNSNASTSANTTTTNTPANTTFQGGSTNSAANPATNSARLSTSNTATAATPSADTLSQAESNAPVAEVQPMATPAPKPQVLDDADKNMAKVAPATPLSKDNPNAAGATRQRNERDKEESYSVDGSSDSKTSDEKAKTARAVPTQKKKRDSGAGEQRSVGGKTFNNVGGIWFDSAVGKQKQKTVRRGTSEYQKLDAGLRSIADSLGGTVVILWGGKAYRIQ